MFSMPFPVVALLCLALLLSGAGCAKKIIPEPASPAAAPAPAPAAGAVTLAEQPEESAAEAAPAVDSYRPALVFFAYDSYLLSDQARTELQEQARLLLQRPLLRLTLAGHADERGSDSYNLALGEKRARAVERYLVTLGVDAQRLTVLSYGEEQPLDPGHDEGAWRKNRRTELVETN